MDFDEFVKHLLRAGWRPRPTGDTQLVHIRKLWDLLIERGLVIHRGGSGHIIAECPSCHATGKPEVFLHYA